MNLLRRCIAAAALALAIPGFVLADAPPAAAQIDHEQLQGRIQQGDAKLVVLDVRTPEEFAAGHVPGARNIPHDALAARVAELESVRDSDIVVYCRSGRRSQIAIETLTAKGFTRLGHLNGDFLAWQAANRPIEKAQAATPPAAPAPPPSPPTP